MSEPTRADLLEAELLEVHAALAVALHVPLGQINPNALPDYIRELARQTGTIPHRDRDTWFSQPIDRYEAEMGGIAGWLNELGGRPGVDFVAEFSVHDTGANYLVLARVIWDEKRP